MNHYKTALFGALLATSLLAGAEAHAAMGISFTSPSDEYQETGATGNIVGWSFTANTDLYATRLAVYDTDRDISPEPSHFIGLWNNAGALMASTTVTETGVKPNGFGYHWANITQTRLTAGQTYYVGAVMGSDHYTAQVPNSIFGYGDPTPFGNLQIYSGITYNADAFYYLANGENPNGITFGSASLTSGINGPDTIIGGLGANIDLTPTPIPAAAWLLGSGLLGLAGIRRKKN
jgi:hypothetical protein